MKRLNFSVSPLLIALLCVMCYLDPIGVFVPFLLAAGLHEAAHVLALYLLRVPIHGFQLGLGGAVLQIGTIGAWQEALCAAAGPLCNLLLFTAFFRVSPLFSLVNLLLAVYNLLPLYPLDGGRLLRLLLFRICGERIGAIALSAVSVTFLIFLTGVAVWLTCIRHVGLYPCLFTASLLLRLPANTSCNRRHCRLQ